jgi:hypothetical protein
MECQYDGILGDSENKLYNRGWTPLLARLIVNLKRDSWYRRADERTVFVSVIGHQELWTPLQLFFTEQMPNQHKKGQLTRGAHLRCCLKQQPRRYAQAFKARGDE